MSIGFDGTLPDLASDASTYWNGTPEASWDLKLGAGYSESFVGPALWSAGNFFPSVNFTGVIFAENVGPLIGDSRQWAANAIRLEYIYGIYLPHSDSMDLDSALNAVYNVGPGPLYHRVMWGDVFGEFVQPSLSPAFAGTIDTVSVTKITPVPEPATAASASIVLLVVAVALRRYRTCA